MGRSISASKVTTRPAILIVEDEEQLGKLISRQLEKEGFAPELVLDGAKVLDVIAARKFSLIILDIKLPHKSGFEILESLRSEGNKVPILLLSGMRRTQDRIKGLELGADDYLIKPFDGGELSARIQALLRRGQGSQEAVLKAGDLTMDVLRRTVTREGRTIELSPREFTLLEFMIRNKNKILTRERIAEQVWGYKFETGTNIVDVYVSYLRRAINDGYRTKMVHTLCGEGFILMENQSRDSAG
jgi:DNA-binding response OmpR family regulator